MENHHFQLENPVFLWPFSIAMLNYQRVIVIVFSFFTFHPTHPIWENDVDEKYWDGLKPPTTLGGFIGF